MGEVPASGEEPVLEIDFYSDWIEILRAELVRIGCSVDVSLPPDPVSCAYFNLLKRKVHPRPRAVHLPQDFSCPAEHSTALQILRGKVERGEEIWPYQSRSLLKLDVNDGLLNDWGIHHFHLGTTSASDGFIERTKLVLFARVTLDDFYMLDVAPHGDEPADFARHRLLKILHQNWPGSLKSFRGQGFTLVQPHFDDAKRADLRKKGLTTFVQMDDGTVYFPIGGGYMVGGLSTEVRRVSDYHATRAVTWQRWVRDNLEALRDLAQAAGHPLPPRPHFRFHLDRGVAMALELHSGVNFQLPASVDNNSAPVAA